MLLTIQAKCSKTMQMWRLRFLATPPHNSVETVVGVKGTGAEGDEDWGKEGRQTWF